MTIFLTAWRGFGRPGAIAMVIIGLAAGSAFAMGGGSGGGSGGSSGSDGSSGSSGGGTGTTVKTGKRLGCPKGFVISADKKKCLRQKRSGLADELPAVGWGDFDDGFLNAAVLAHAGQYDEAIVAFKALARPDDAYVLTYLGYSHRKLDQIDAALAYYDRALTIRPDYVRARQYLGEGLLALGRLDEARGQLDEISRRCGRTCKPYQLLKSQIADFQNSI